MNLDTSNPHLYSEAEWHRNNYKWLRQSNDAREEFSRIREEAKHVMQETEIITESTQSEVTEHLEARARDILHWKKEFQKSLEELSVETHKLVLQKSRLENSLEAAELCLMVTRECLTLRRQRIGSEIVEDDVQLSLLKEEDLLVHIKGLVHKAIHEAASQIRNDMSVKEALEKDWSDKWEAYSIDTFCSHLHNLATGSIAFYHGREELPDRWVTIETWVQFTRNNHTQCRNEIATSSALRAIINNLLKDIAHDIKEQQDSVDLALARRIAELADAIYRLKQHLKLLAEDIALAEKTINELKTAILEKEQPLKKAQTRLHYRYQRPNMELVKDPAQHSLLREVREIAANIETLKEHLATAEKSLEKLLETRKGLETELAVKEATLCIDRERVVAIRQRFPPQFKILGHS